MINPVTVTEEIAALLDSEGYRRLVNQESAIWPLAYGVLREWDDTKGLVPLYSLAVPEAREQVLMLAQIWEMEGAP